MQTPLFSLFYAGSNLERRVYYEDSPRAIGFTNVAIDNTQPVRGAHGPPDAYPYADGDVLSTRYEGQDTVTITGIYASPFGRIAVTTAPATTCDLAVTNMQVSQGTLTFSVSTSHAPWASSLKADSLYFTDNKASYPVAPGTYTLYVRDAAGCVFTQAFTAYDLNQPATPTYQPAGAILLRRRTLPSSQSPDLFRVKEDWYDPATRTAATYYPADSPDGTEYYRDPSEVIDRWCQDPGVAPYTEIQVHPNAGSGNVVFVPVDGVLACQNVCTLTLRLQVTQPVGGRGEILAIAGGAQGTVLFTLDGFATPGLPPNYQVLGLPAYDFTLLKPGRYTVTVRETRAGGCVATASVVLKASYGPRYELNYYDLRSTPCRLRIYQRDYQGEVEQVLGQYLAVTLDWPGQVTDHVFAQLVRGSECQLAWYFQYVDQLLPLFSGDERLHRVEYERAGQLLWKGYLLPEQYDVAFLAPPATFNFSATDGLGALSTMPFTGPAGERLRGDWRVLDVLLYLLGKLEVDLPLRTLVNIYPSVATLAAPALEQIRVDVGQYQDDKGTPWDCGKVLTALLTPLAARLYQQDGAWWLERLRELTSGTLTYVCYAPDGTRLADESLNRVVSVSLPNGQLYWLGANQRQSLRPAVATVTVAADPGEVVNLLNPFLPKNSDLPAAKPASWTASPGDAVSQLIYQGKDKTPILRLLGTTANATRPELAGWVQPPAATPIPLRDFGANGAYDGTFTFSFTLKAYGFTPSDTPAQQSTLYVALKFGPVWVAPFLAVPGESEHVEDVLKISYTRLNDAAEQKVSFRGYGASPKGPQPVLVRFYQPVGGATACTVDITDIEVSWENVALETAETYTTTYTTSTDVLVTRVDAGTTLFHSDTPAVRRQGTWLDAAGLPVQAWYTPAGPGLLRELGDYLVTDRNLWQRTPAQVLTGALDGVLSGPGHLLTDPREQHPALYVLTNATHSASPATWQLGAVQLTTATLPLAADEAGPDTIYTESYAALTAEDGAFLLYEHA